MTMFERIRSRHAAARRTRAIERALRGATSHAVRQEIIAIIQRDS